MTDIAFDENDDAVDIAIKVFRGTDRNRYYWRMYLDAMAILEKSPDRAAEEFLSWVWFKGNELEKDGVPDRDNLHARCFHKFLKQMFRAKYGEVRFADVFGWKERV